MHIEGAIELLKALDLEIKKSDRQRHGHPSDRAARKRARGVAEKEAMRRLIRTDSFESALTVGRDAYRREMRYFSPLTLVRDTDAERSDDPRVISLDGPELTDEGSAR